MTQRKIQYWVIPPESDAEFAANMEEVLETYAKPYDAKHPVVCMDEQPVQLIKEPVNPLPPPKRIPAGLIMNMSVPEQPAFSCLPNLCQAGVKPMQDHAGQKWTGLLRWPVCWMGVMQVATKSRWSVTISTPIPKGRFMRL